MPRAWLITNRRWAARSRQAGFSVVEVLLAATVFGVLVTGLIGALVYGRSSTADAGAHVRADFLAEEGIEAARNIGNAAYSNLVDGTYGLVQTGGQWAFSGTSDTSDIYTRQVAVATAGTNRKAITSTVTWLQANGGTATVTLTARIVNWEANIKLWSNAIVAGSVNPATAGVKVATQGNYAYEVLSATTNNFVVVNISGLLSVM